MGTSQRTAQRYLLFAGATAVGDVPAGASNESTKAYFNDDFRNSVLEITASNPVSLTIKVVGSNISDVNTTSATETYPNFAVADSVTNPWSYLQIVDLNTGVFSTGSTGVAITTAGTYKYEVNVNAVRWVGLEISGYVSGSIKASITLTDNR